MLYVCHYSLLIHKNSNNSLVKVTEGTILILGNLGLKKCWSGGELNPQSSRFQFSVSFYPDCQAIVCYAKFFSSYLLRFWSLGYPGVRGLGWQGHTCIKNLSRVGVEICTKFGGDWSSGSRVKEGHKVGWYTGTNSLFYIHR